jgi:hypothetical protein
MRSWEPYAHPQAHRLSHRVAVDPRLVLGGSVGGEP